MKNTKKILPDEEVTVKLSICNKCGGIVNTAIEHMMTTKTKNEFAKEALEYNLNIKTISLLEYRATENKWCNCNE